MRDANRRRFGGWAFSCFVFAGWLAALTSAPGQAAAQVELKAGAAAVKLELPLGVPLAGYGGRRSFPDVFGQYPYAHYFPPSTGEVAGEETRVKAVLLERDGKRLAFVSLDLVGIDRALRNLIVQELEAPPLFLEADAVVLSATHTHSGPGALSANHFMEFAATDRIHVDLQAIVVARVVTAVKGALADLQKAELFHFSEQAPDLHKNRSRDAGYGDHVLSVIALRDVVSSAWIGALVNFAVHGTAHRETNSQLSADYPGALERALAKAMGASDPSSFPVLFLNGAEGDVIPTKSPAVMQGELDSFAALQWADWWASPPQPVAVDAWEIETAEVALGRPFLYLRSELKPLQDSFPISRLGIELETYFPTHARIWSIALAGLRLMTVPGEPTSEVGLELRAAAAQVGLPDIWILGLTNDHVGYFATPADWKLAAYESSGSQYGAYGSRRLVNKHLFLLRP